MSVPFRVKVCGLLDADNARACVEAGADAIGLNFCRQSKRYCPPEVAVEIAAALRGIAQVVGLFVDATGDEIEQIRSMCNLDWIQLHGSEAPGFVESLGPRAYKAVNGATKESWPGACLLVDAPELSEDLLPGGYGRAWGWEAATFARRDPNQALVLAGGLNAGNVALAIKLSGADAVDVASGVEMSPGIKDPEQVRQFAIRARTALNL